jgi:hypothetical protein
MCSGVAVNAETSLKFGAASLRIRLSGIVVAGTIVHRAYNGTNLMSLSTFGLLLGKAVGGRNSALTTAGVS